MKSFSSYLRDTFIVMEGGNCPVIDRETGKVLASADRVDMSKVNRGQLQSHLVSLFKVLNTKFQAKNKEPIWKNFEVVTSGRAFNGSSEHFMDKEISDEEFREEKKTMGDVDITIPHKYLKPLFDLLADHENQRLTKDFIYLGQNKKEQHGHQINAVFQLQEPKINMQIDFEGTGYTDKDEPDEFAKFSHSSNWEDVRAGIKGLGHKHLLVNIARALSEIKNAVVLTPSSPVEPPEKIKISKSASAKMPTNLAFSVDRGVRTKYEPVKNSKGELVKVDGKQAFRELATSDSKYETNVPAIYTMIFNQKPDNEDLSNFRSFSGILRLFKKHNVEKRLVENVFRFMIDKSFFGRGSQGTDSKSAENDYEVKMTILNKMVQEFPYLKSILESKEKQIKAYVDNYKTVEKRD